MTSWYVVRKIKEGFMVIVELRGRILFSEAKLPARLIEPFFRRLKRNLTHQSLLKGYDLFQQQRAKYLHFMSSRYPTGQDTINRNRHCRQSDSLLPVQTMYEVLLFYLFQGCQIDSRKNVHLVSYLQCRASIPLNLSFS